MSAGVPRSVPATAVSARPPLPRQHGAWMMLYKPLLATLIGLGGFGFGGASVLDTCALLVAATGGFFAQNAAGLVFRKRATIATWVWLAAYAGAAVLSAVYLIAIKGHGDLLLLAVPAFALFFRNARYTEATRRNVDRSVLGEFLGIGGLVLTAPAAYVVAGGGLDASAAGIWFAWVVLYGSSVFYVKMRISAAQVRDGMTMSRRLGLGRRVLLYHAAMAGITAASFGWLQADLALTLSVGVLPILARALQGVLALSPGLPNLKSVGLSEMAFTTWFAACFAVAMSMVG